MLLEKIMNQLLEKKYTITTAESCTGGLLAGRLIDFAGASDVYKEGYITYANEAKEKILGVSHDTLLSVGAVSKETAYEMAEGAAKAAGADAALSVTGIAGPGGGTEEKPVGLVYIGCYVKGEITVKKYIFQGDRQSVRRQAVNAALELLWEKIERL